MEQLLQPGEQRVRRLLEQILDGISIRMQCCMSAIRYCQSRKDPKEERRYHQLLFDLAKDRMKYNRRLKRLMYRLP